MPVPRHGYLLRLVYAMIAGIASLVFIPLLAIAMVHMLWAFGATWPAKDRQMLAATIAGKEPLQSRWWSFVVGLFVFAGGIWALALSDPSINPVLRIGGAVWSVIFLVRGAVGFWPEWQQQHAAEPFATTNRKLYSPLCIAVALGFAYLTAWPFI